jgi:CBS domain-containing protein
MKVDMICQRAVITIHKSASVLEAARRMREHHVGDLVVVETKEGSRVPVGILTDRDLVVQVLAMEVAEIENLQVGDLLTDDLITITADAAPHLAMTRMRAEGVRRLPVVDTSGALVQQSG